MFLFSNSMLNLCLLLLRYVTLLISIFLIVLCCYVMFLELIFFVFFTNILCFHFRTGETCFSDFVTLIYLPCKLFSYLQYYFTSKIMFNFNYLIPICLNPIRTVVPVTIVPLRASVATVVALSVPLIYILTPEAELDLLYVITTWVQLLGPTRTLEFT